MTTTRKVVMAVMVKVTAEIAFAAVMAKQVDQSLDQCCRYYLWKSAMPMMKRHCHQRYRDDECSIVILIGGRNHCYQC